jgi:hypothetical protein
MKYKNLTLPRLTKRERIRDIVGRPILRLIALADFLHWNWLIDFMLRIKMRTIKWSAK